LGAVAVDGLQALKLFLRLHAFGGDSEAILWAMSTMERTISAFSLGVSVPLMKERSNLKMSMGNYFHFRNCSHIMTHVRAHMEQRVRTHLCTRHKRKRHECYH